MDLQTETGKLNASEFSRRGNFLIYAVNSIACDSYGIVKDLQAVYKHESVYTRRKRLYNLSRAEVNSRETPGTLIVQAPSDVEDNEGSLPHLIACVTQFGWGEAIEDNTKARQAVNLSQDWHYVSGLREDTKVNRRHFFKTCMKKLCLLVMGHQNVERLYFPEGIGCRGRCNSEWKEHYLPEIQSVATRLKPFGVVTFLVRLPE